MPPEPEYDSEGNEIRIDEASKQEAFFRKELEKINK